jgi:hypothetical protein
MAKDVKLIKFANAVKNTTAFTSFTMDAALLSKWGQAGAGIALSAYLLSRPGACDAAVKGAVSTIGCVKSLVARAIALDEPYLEGSKGPMTMMRPEAPPNFWEREVVEINGR